MSDNRFPDIDEESYAALESVEEMGLRALPIVVSLVIHRPSNMRKATLNDWYVQPKLNCGCARMKLVAMHCAMSRPTIGHALRAIRLNLIAEHAECIARATERDAAHGGTTISPNAFAVMT